MIRASHLPRDPTLARKLKMLHCNFDLASPHISALLIYLILFHPTFGLLQVGSLFNLRRSRSYIFFSRTFFQRTSLLLSGCAHLSCENTLTTCFRFIFILRTRFAKLRTTKTKNEHLRVRHAQNQNENLAANLVRTSHYQNAHFAFWRCEPDAH